MISENISGDTMAIKGTSTSRNHVAIIGVNRITKAIYNRAQNFISSDQEIVGCINIDPLKESFDSSQYPQLLGNIYNLRELIHSFNITNVLIAIDACDVQNLHDVIQACQKANVDYELVSNFYDVSFGGAITRLLKSFSNSFEFRLRRIIDIILATIIFFIILPIWLFIAILIKLDSYGSVLCSQEVVGKDQQSFNAFKFRTIFFNKNKEIDQKYALSNTPALTRMGRFLWKTNLENLPLLLNVLMGDISFIGPGFERPYYDEKYGKEVPFYSNRLKVKPGLFSYAQAELGVNGTVENIREKLRYDFFYVDHRKSVLLNLKILLKVLWRSIKGR